MEYSQEDLEDILNSKPVTKKKQDKVNKVINKKVGRSTPLRNFIPKFTTQEQDFIDLVSNSPDLTLLECVRRCWPDLKNPKGKYSSLISREDITDELHARQVINRDRADYSAEDVTSRLWKEASSSGKGSSQLARINALQLLGKHIGMFKEKPIKEEGSTEITYNIVNYSPESTSEKVIPILEQLPTETLEELQVAPVSSSFKVTSYNSNANRTDK
jgi:hypothetical protein